MWLQLPHVLKIPFLSIFLQFAHQIPPFLVFITFLFIDLFPLVHKPISFTSKKANSSLDHRVSSAYLCSPSLMVLESLSFPVMISFLPIELWFPCGLDFLLKSSVKQLSILSCLIFKDIHIKTALSESPLYFFNRVLLLKLLSQLRLRFYCPLFLRHFFQEHIQFNMSKPNTPHRSALKPTSLISYLSQEHNNLSISHTRDPGFIFSSFFPAVINSIINKNLVF